MNVELHTPTDLQHAMALAHAYERLANAQAAQGVPHPVRAIGKAPQYSSATTSTVTAAPLPAEIQERRRQGLCYNYDEQYVRGHKCLSLFYLEVTYFLDDELVSADDQPVQLLDDTDTGAQWDFDSAFIQAPP